MATTFGNIGHERKIFFEKPGCRPIAHSINGPSKDDIKFMKKHGYTVSER